MGTNRSKTVNEQYRYKVHQNKFTGVTRARYELASFWVLLISRESIGVLVKYINNCCFFLVMMFLFVL